MGNRLTGILLGSGTGIIQGFFRTPVPLISYVNYAYMVNTKQKLENGDAALVLDKDLIDSDFITMEESLGDTLPCFKRMLSQPIINLSDVSGNFLGTYFITDIHDPGSGDSDGQYVITIDSGDERITIQIDTNQVTLNSDYGTCEIYIEEGADLLTFWE